MSAKMKSVLRWLRDTLTPENFEDIGYNGLQVEADLEELNTVGFAVDATMETIEAAHNAGCGLLIVHHGLFWGPGIKSVRGMMANRLRRLLGHNMALYASHLPLDAHMIYGNNSLLAHEIHMENPHSFCKSHGQRIGFSGRLPSKPTSSELAYSLERLLKTKVKIIGHPDVTLTKVGVVTGNGSSAMRDVVAQDLDALVTGEVTYEAEVMAHETKKVILCAGHYETETLGVKTLSEAMALKFDVSTPFIDIKPSS